MEGVEAQRTYWDEYYRGLDERGSDLDWGGRWTDPFLSMNGDLVEFRTVDMAAGLPFPKSGFDAVMANVALHMFTDLVTRSVFADVRRVLRAGGLFLFHVNAHDDRPLRQRARPVLRELEPDYVLEEAGQTVRFFSRAYLDDLLTGWQVVMLEHLEIAHARPDVPFKRVWRVAART